MRRGTDPVRRAGRWWSRRLLAVVAAGSALVLTASAAPVPAAPVPGFVLLQMNLCNSGMAIHSCYSFGRAVDEAVRKIHRYPPELVTLQEVCQDDLFAPGGGWGKLAQAMADLYGSDRISVEFMPALDRRTGDGYRCVDGALFGVAMMYHDNGLDQHAGWYRSQDGSDEERAWVCTTVIALRLTGCTTHLATDPEVALRQCHELVSILAAPWVLPEVIVAGDFNLRSSPGAVPSALRCEPAGYRDRSDGSLQQVFYTRTVRWLRGRSEAMRWTDHPLLYERFRV